MDKKMISAGVPYAVLIRQAVALTGMLSFFVWILVNRLSYGEYALAIPGFITAVSAFSIYTYLARKARFGSFLTVFENHVEFAHLDNPQTVRYEEISKIVHGEKDVYFVLSSGVRLRAPRGKNFEEVYQYLCKNIPNNFGKPPYFGARIGFRVD